MSSRFGAIVVVAITVVLVGFVGIALFLMRSPDPQSADICPVGLVCLSRNVQQQTIEVVIGENQTVTSVQTEYTRAPARDCNLIKTIAKLAHQDRMEPVIFAFPRNTLPSCQDIGNPNFVEE